MGNCKYCGRSAGLLKSEHRECADKYAFGWQRMKELAASAFEQVEVWTNLVPQLEAIARESYIPVGAVRSVLADAWNEKLNGFLDDGFLTADEEHHLGSLREHYSLEQDELERTGAFTRALKAVTLRDLLEGSLPSRVTFEGSIPFNLQKAETLIWLFHNVNYFEYRSSTRYVARSQGVSIRLARGLYYRLGAFEGNPITQHTMVLADTGSLGLTNKHIYFSGANKHFRIPYTKIVEFLPFSDGIGVQRDAATARPQIFATDDGWFTYNMVVNLAQSDLA